MFVFLKTLGNLHNMDQIQRHVSLMLKALGHRVQLLNCSAGLPDLTRFAWAHQLEPKDLPLDLTVTCWQQKFAGIQYHLHPFLVKGFYVFGSHYVIDAAVRMSFQFNMGDNEALEFIREFSRHCYEEKGCRREDIGVVLYDERFDRYIEDGRLVTQDTYFSPQYRARWLAGIEGRPEWHHVRALHEAIPTNEEGIAIRAHSIDGNSLWRSYSDITYEIAQLILPGGSALTRREFDAMLDAAMFQKP